MFDGDGVPAQYGVMGVMDEGDGLTDIQGLALGIVLNVYPSDDPRNEAFKLFSNDVNNNQAGAKVHMAEADVFIIASRGRTSFVKENVIILPQGKCSQYLGPGPQEADWTEDIPNGSSRSEVEDFLAEDGERRIKDLSGDWVVLGFIGGILETPVMLTWFPSPYNQRDPATRADGNRYILRRNGFEFRIDKDGNGSLSHKAGHYLEFKADTFTLKHKSGTVLQIEQNGDTSLVAPSGNTVHLSEEGLSIQAENVTVQILNGNVNITSSTGNVRINATNIDLVGGQITMSDGNESPEPLAKAQVLTLAKNAALLAEQAFAAAAALQTANLPAAGTILTDAAPLLASLQILKRLQNSDYLTSNTKGS